MTGRLLTGRHHRERHPRWSSHTFPLDHGRRPVLLDLRLLLVETPHGGNRPCRHAEHGRGQRRAPAAVEHVLDELSRFCHSPSRSRTCSIERAAPVQADSNQALALGEVLVDKVSTFHTLRKAADGALMASTSAEERATIAGVTPIGIGTPGLRTSLESCRCGSVR